MKKNYKFVLQENMYDCGVAALKTIFLQYGKTIKSSDVVRKSKSQGTTAYELIFSSKKLGLNAKGVKTKIDELSNSYFPCIAHVIKDKNYFHYIVIFEKDNINKKMVILDPSIGIKTITYQEFKEITTNIFILFDKNEIKKKKDKRFKNTINSLIKYNKIIIFKNFFLCILYLSLTIFFNYYFKIFLDNITFTNILIRYSLIFIVIVILKNVIYNLKNKSILEFNMKIDKQLTNKLINHIICLPNNVYLNKTIGELSIILNDIYNFKTIIAKLFIIFSIDIVLLLSVLIIISTYGIIYLFFFIFTIFILIFISIKYKYTFNNNYLQTKNSQMLFNSKFIEFLNGYNSIKNLNIESKIIKKLKNYSKNSRNNEYIYLNNNNRYLFINNVLIDLFYVIVITLSVFITHDLTSIVFISSIYYLLFDTVQNICEVISMYNTYEISIYRVLDLFDEQIEDTLKENKLTINKIDFNNVCFSYEEKNMLNNLNLTISKNEKILITGETGSGKSTLIKILLKYFSCSKGNIKINNIDIDNINNGILRNSITYVSQDETLFVDTINNNLRISNNNNNRQIKKAINTCLIDDIYKKNNIDSFYILEENGLNLSGGERKKLLIARGLLKNSGFIIFDESFNEIDVKTERKILNNIFKNYPEKTIIVITHRLNNKDLFEKCYELKNKKLILKEERV